MTENKLRNEAVHYERLKQRLLDDYPDLVDDEETLQDTLDGATNLHELIASVCRSAQEDAALSKGLGAYMAELVKRKARLDTRAQRKRDLVTQVMQDSGINKVEAPDLTVSKRTLPRKPVVTDIDALSDCFFKIECKPNMTVIKNAIADGNMPTGVELDNGGTTITIRNS